MDYRNVLRHFLSEHSAVKKIIHFGTHQVFKNRSTYTCILVLSKEQQREFSISFVRDWNRLLFEHKTDFEQYDESVLSKDAWTFIPKQVSESLSNASTKCEPLEAFADIFVGVQTSADKIYIIYAQREDMSFVYFTDKNNQTRKVEKGILRKSIYDARLTKFERIQANSYIIFPYTEDNGKPTNAARFSRSIQIPVCQIEGRTYSPPYKW